MRDNGPVVHFWSMATESKHRLAKKVAAGTSSFKDLPYTVGIKYQISLCVNKEKFKGVENDYELGLQNNNAKNELFIIQQHLENVTSSKMYKHITILGHKFKEGTIFFYNFNEFGDPVFAKLKNIVEFNNNLYFYAKPFDTLYFNENYHSHVVGAAKAGAKLIPLQDVKRKPPCLLYKNCTDEVCISSRYD